MRRWWQEPARWRPALDGPGWPLTADLVGRSMSEAARALGRFGSRAGRPVKAPPRWLIGLTAATAALLVVEIQTSWIQARLLAAAARRVTYEVGPGPSPSIRYPAGGPYDYRLGYPRQPEFIRRLQDAGYVVTAQTRWSPWATAIADRGLFPIYAEKAQAGLRLLDARGRPLYTARHPNRVYERFDDIPPVVVASLLFAENRELLREPVASRNPAIEYPRLLRAIADAGRRVVDPDHPVSGGSTLATQLEKLRHSPDGRTGSVSEKARQVVSASLRAYRQGTDTAEARRQIVLDYVNALPLGAVADHGEVIGLADGLRAWYGADVDEVNRLLADAANAGRDDPALPSRAIAYRQALSLLLAARRPTAYLVDHPDALDARVNAYLRALVSSGVIPPALGDATLTIRLARRAPAAPHPPSFADRKAVDAVRIELATRLGLPGLYDLDRLDLVARTTIDREVNDAVARALAEVTRSDAARRAGLTGERLLGAGDASGVVYSVTLFERSTGGHLLRVQADNYAQPLDINEGTRLELGSTAKLRTLTTYLEIVEALHRQYADLPAPALGAVRVHPNDRLRAWAVAYLARAGDRSLPAMLEAALDRRYSASPGEAFFTGGGVHRFSNFDPGDNGRVVTVREAFRQSINLPFVRLMRDVAAHYIYASDEWAGVLHDPRHPARTTYLARFADQEGRTLLARFYVRQQDPTAGERLLRLARAAGGRPSRLAAIFRAVRPDASHEAFEAFVRAHATGRPLTASEMRTLFERTDPLRWTWQDLGYLSGVHPLELWLARYLERRPSATLAEAVDASAAERQAAYQWLFATRNRAAQDRAVRTIIEQMAFERIHESWRRQGYPFASLVPSLASTLGSSGDNPRALSELVGLILNRGVRAPAIRVTSVRFGEDTPYDTELARRAAPGERVLSEAVAAALRHELVGVVEHGTGRRLAGGLALGDGRVLPIGGKTGTGDNRFETVGPGGRRSRVVNRTATFVFTVGDRFFGTVVAFVPGPEAAAYGFTSALPVQLLRHLLPALTPLIEGTPGE